MLQVTITPCRPFLRLAYAKKNGEYHLVHQKFPLQHFEKVVAASDATVAARVYRRKLYSRRLHRVPETRVAAPSKRQKTHLDNHRLLISLTIVLGLSKMCAICVENTLRKLVIYRRTLDVIGTTLWTAGHSKQRFLKNFAPS